MTEEELRPTDLPDRATPPGRSASARSAGTGAGVAATDIPDPSQQDARRLVHELQVHQIELEMQNEALSQAQAALEASRDRYLDLYELAPVGYLTLTREALIAEVNLTGAALLGRNRSELLNSPFARFVAPEDGDDFHRMFGRALQCGGAQSCDLSIVRDDRSCFTAHLDCLPLAAAATPAVRITLSDITEKKSSAVPLRQGEESFSRLFEVEKDAVALVDCASGRILAVNAAAEKMYGYTRAEFLKLHAGDVSAEGEGTGALVGARASAFRTRRHRRKDGTEFPVEIANSQFVSEGREVSVAAIRDVSVRQLADQALHDSVHRFSTLFYASPVAMLMSRGDDMWIVEANDAFLAMSGYQRAELAGRTAMELGMWADPRQRDAMLAIAGQQGHIRELEVEFRRKSGELRVVLVSSDPIEMSDGRYVLATMLDITERKRVEDNLRIAGIAFESQEGIVVTDTRGIIVRVNDAFTRLTGYGAADALGKTPAMLSSGRHDKAFYERMWLELLQTGYWQGEIWNRHKNGSVFAEWLTISAVKGGDGNTTHYVGTFSEITKNKEAEAEIHRLAYYDSLTHLPNRRLLHDRVTQALAGSKRSGHHGALLFLDLDNFKSLNDTRGHDVGDQLLIETARRIEDNVREGDTVARLGGDEFVVMLEDLSTEAQDAAVQTRLVAEKIRADLSRPYDLQGREFHCAASFGAALFREQATSVEELLQHADLAMYKAKNAGRNTVRFFDPAMQIALDERSALEADLRMAVEGQQLQIYYQPQIDRNGSLVGAEALLRWVSPQRGLVSPADFIPMAEETGLIIPIGRWVLDTALTRLKAWSASPATRSLRLAVNVSPHQFRQLEFVAQVREAAARSGADPSRLKIELTESMVLDDVPDTFQTMHALKALGLGFSLDDFGTGYSSLSYLARLPIDQLKIDSSFVRNLPDSRNDAIIAQTIITMATSLGLDVIAEGVETEAQKAFLDRHDCSAYQGYLFSHPLPLEEFEQFAVGRTA
jgi:diguanylate cyclase (GGDEF)-like protein/PAS domain S-box-containing protein